MNKLTDYELNSLNKLVISIEENKWSKEALVQLIELVGSYLDLKTIPEYAKQASKSYNGVKKFRDIHVIFGIKFVIDNK